MPGRLAAQLYTVRDYTKTAEGFDNVLGLCHEIGYAGVQLSAIGCMSGESPEVSPKTAREMLDAHGLECCATHASLEALQAQTQCEIETLRGLRCDYVAIGGIWPNDLTEFQRFPGKIKSVAEELHSSGIRFGYHNHAHEFARCGESEPGVAASGTYYDFLITLGAPDLMLELDTYWVLHAGVDPVKLLRRCRGRVPVIHVKDKEVIPGEGPVFAPVGEGNLDWPAIIEAGEEAGVEWYVVEQDTCRRDPFDCLRSSFDYLERLLS